MLELISGILFALFNPISLLALIAVALAWSVPIRYLSLYICSVITSVAIFSIPNNSHYFRPGRFDFIGFSMIDCARTILIVGFAVVVIVKIRQQVNAHEDFLSNRLIKILSYVLAGFLSAFFFYLLCTNFFEGYQAALEAYIIVIAFILLGLLFGLLSQNTRFISYRCLEGIHSLFYSFSLFMTIAMVVNSAFALTAYKQTKKMVENNSTENVKYCIQTKGRGLNSWLELTPLTIWNKPKNRRSAGTRHAVLTIVRTNEQAIYHWSYKLRDWQYNSAGFDPGGALVPASLDCTLEKNYLANIPLIFSQPQTLYLEHKQFKIPIQYLPRQIKLTGENGQKISLHALLPNFTAVKQIFSRLLLQEILTTTNIWIGTANAENTNNIWFKALSELETQELKGEFGLQKRIVPQVKYKLQKETPYSTKEVQQHVQYYEKEDGIVKTVILCAPDQSKRFNCEHHFINGNLQYSFRHSDRNLKDWRKLQATLVSRLKSWAVRESDL
ncbi:MAG: hypothetical protein AAFY50_23900 [Cyanobacteria bacterium J06648_1]